MSVATETSAAALRRSFSHEQIIGIDMLRLLAATLVVLFHFGFFDWTWSGSILSQTFAGQQPIIPMFHFGWVGVEIFFVISGFVITYSAQGVSAARFARSRFLRLVPGAWVCGTLSFVLLAVVLHESSRRLVLDYVYTLAFWPLRAINIGYWTLGIEIAFYVLVYGLMRAGKLGFLARYIGVIGLGSGVFWIVALGLEYGLENATGVLGTLYALVLKAEASRYLQLILVQHGCFFALGTLMQRCSAQGLSRRRAMCLAGLVIACLLEIIGQNNMLDRLSGIHTSALPALGAWALAMALMAAAIAWNAQLVGVVGRKVGLFRLAGRITYPLYLCHNEVIFAVTVVLAPMLGLHAVAIGIVTAYLCSWLIEWLPERSLRRVLARVLPREAAARRAFGGTQYS